MNMSEINKNNLRESYPPKFRFQVCYSTESTLGKLSFYSNENTTSKRGKSRTVDRVS